MGGFMPAFSTVALPYLSNEDTTSKVYLNTDMSAFFGRILNKIFYVQLSTPNLFRFSIHFSIFSNNCILFINSLYSQHHKCNWISDNYFFDKTWKTFEHFGWRKFLYDRMDSYCFEHYCHSVDGWQSNYRYSISI